MHRFRRLMVNLPAEPGAARSLIRYAEMLARMGTLVEAQFLRVLAPDRTADRPAGPQVAGQARASVLAETEGEVAAHFSRRPEIRVGCNVVKGQPRDALLQFAEEQEADLMLIGQRRGDADQQRLARELARSAPCSVWIVPEGAPADVRRVLVPIDFSAAAADALEVATEIARRAGDTECLALHVELRDLEIDYGAEGVKVNFRKVDPQTRARNEQTYQGFIETIDRHGIDVVPLFETGGRVDAIIERTADERRADLLVMSTHGRTRWAALLDACVAEQTIGQDRFPLLVVKHFGARIRLLEALIHRVLQR